MREDRATGDSYNSFHTIDLPGRPHPRAYESLDMQSLVMYSWKKPIHNHVCFLVGTIPRQICPVNDGKRSDPSPISLDNMYSM